MLPLHSLQQRALTSFLQLLVALTVFFFFDGKIESIAEEKIQHVICQQMLLITSGVLQSSCTQSINIQEYSGNPLPHQAHNCLIFINEFIKYAL